MWFLLDSLASPSCALCMWWGRGRQSLSPGARSHQLIPLPVASPLHGPPSIPRRPRAEDRGRLPEFSLSHSRPAPLPTAPSLARITPLIPASTHCNRSPCMSPTLDGDGWPRCKRSPLIHLCSCGAPAAQKVSGKYSFNKLKK